MKKLLIWIMAILLISSAYALNFEKSTEVDLKIPCENDGKPCSSSATCNITIKYPNSTFLINFVEMTNQNNGDFNITLNENQTNVLGEYAYSVYCSDGGYHGAAHETYIITPTGGELDKTKTDNYTIAVIIFIIGLVGLFAYLSFNLREEHFALSVFFLLAIFIVLLIGSNVVINLADIGIESYDGSISLETASDSLQNSLGNLYYWIIIIFIIVIMYVIGYILLIALSYMRQKKEAEFE